MNKAILDSEADQESASLHILTQDRLCSTLLCVVNIVPTLLRFLLAVCISYKPVIPQRILCVSLPFLGQDDLALY